MKLVYSLLLMFVVSCGNNAENTDKDTTDANKDAEATGGITAEQAVARADVFVIQRVTEDPVTLAFNKSSSNPIEVSLNSNECIYVSSEQFKDLKISTGAKPLTLCGYGTQCAEGNFKIVKGNKYNKREPMTNKLDNCRSVDERLSVQPRPHSDDSSQ